MKSIYPFKQKFEVLTVFFFLTVNASFAQLGINTNTPHPSSVLELKDNERGLLIPRLSTDARERMTSSTNPFKPAHSLLVFDTTQGMFYFYDFHHEQVPLWVALNPWQAYSRNGDIGLRTTGRVGIGTYYPPSEKLEVGGNIRVRDTIKTRTVTALRVNSTNLTAINANVANINTNKINSPSGTVVSDGTIAATKFEGEGIIPKGGIIMWHGNPNQLPKGWQLCNGENGSPNLSNKFILSYGEGTEATEGVNSKGGKHFQNLNKTNIPPHTHHVRRTVAKRFGTLQSDGAASGDEVTNGSYTQNTSNGSEDNLGNGGVNGEGAAFDNRPAYYILAFIMKL